VQDHRPLGWGTLDAAGYVESLKTLVALAPDARIRTDHAWWSGHVLLAIHMLHGTREGGPFEDARVSLTEHDAQGRYRRREFYSLAQFDQARARYEALASGASLPRIENAATRGVDQMIRAWVTHDWERNVALFPASYRNIDRQRTAQIEVGRERALDAMREMFDLTTSFTATTLATRGNRLALCRMRWTGSGSEVGPSEHEWLDLFEVDEEVQSVVHVTFDLDDLDAAFAELDARYDAGEGAATRQTPITRAFLRAFAARDWDALAATLAPDLVVHDHRLLGWETLHGPAQYIEALRSLTDLAPDVRLRLDHIETSGRSALYVPVWEGTHEGGAFESPSVFVAELDERDRIRRFDQYDLTQLGDARARYADLRPDPLRIPPNAATRNAQRQAAALKARDLDTLSRLCAPTMLFDDRRRSSLLTGDRDMFVASNRVASGSETHATLLATAGDRLALAHVRRTDPAKAKWEVDALVLHEVDEHDRTVAVIAFDPDDRRAASMEMLERHARSDEARSIPPALFEGLRALNAHDLDKLVSRLPDDFVMDDHRRTGFGRIGSEAYRASLVALFEHAPNVTTETLYAIAIEKHGVLVLSRNFGTLRDGGAFESVFLSIMAYDGDRVTRVEMFEPDDLEAARTRFEELRVASARESAA
jgi:ketosteroid isomerase-like protein